MTPSHIIISYIQDSTTLQSNIPLVRVNQPLPRGIQQTHSKLCAEDNSNQHSFKGGHKDYCHQFRVHNLSVSSESCCALRLFTRQSVVTWRNLMLFCNRCCPRYSPLCGPLDGLIDPPIGTSNESNCLNPIGRQFPNTVSFLSTSPALPSCCLCGHKMTNSPLADMFSWGRSFTNK